MSRFTYFIRGAMAMMAIRMRLTARKIVTAAEIAMRTMSERLTALDAWQKSQSQNRLTANIRHITSTPVYLLAICILAIRGLATAGLMFCLLDRSLLHHSTSDGTVPTWDIAAATMMAMAVISVSLIDRGFNPNPPGKQPS